MKLHVLIAFILMLAATPAMAAMKIDVSESDIQVTTGFNGTSITVFGTQDAPGDVVIVIQGPDKNYTVRRMDRRLGVWTNVDSREFLKAPGYYEIAASSAPILIASPEVLSAHAIGVENLALPDKRKSTSASTQAFRNAFLQRQKDHELYISDAQPLIYVSPTLFKARFTLPAEVPPGRYGVYAYLFRNGELIQEDQTRFEVKPTGVSANMRHFAKDNGLLYGLTAVLISLFAGWLATVLLKRD